MACVKAVITIADIDYEIDLDKPLEIGIPLNPFHKNPSCFYAGQPTASPMIYEGYVCSKEAGAPVNFYEMKFVPHGNGTHTECVGHISSDFEKVNNKINNPFFVSELISIKPKLLENGDHVITKDQLNERIRHESSALIIRTIPNFINKINKNYTETNPPYLTEDAMRFIVDKKYKHLLLDLPSVDKEKDDGLVMNHKIFWDVEQQLRQEKTISELIFVPDNIVDGKYILQLNISNIVLDAVPSRPVLFQIKSQ